MKYCPQCGHKISDDQTICSKCGYINGEASSSYTSSAKDSPYSTSTKKHEEKKPSSSSFTLNITEEDNAIIALIAKIFGALSCVVAILTIFPAIWIVPMTVHMWHCLDRKQPMSLSFKVCYLIFVNIVPGVLLLVHREPGETR